MSLRLPRAFSGPLKASQTKQPNPHMSVELEVEEFLYNGDLPSSSTTANSPFRRILDLRRIVLLRRIVDFKCWWNLHRNDCLIMLIVDIDCLHVFQSTELPFATCVYKHRPDGDIVVTQTAVVV